LELLIEPLRGKSVTVNIFVKKYQYDSTNNPPDMEYVRDIARQAKDNKLRIHNLTIDGSEIGFIAFSVHTLNNSPCLFIEYIFISSQYRKIQYPELDDTTLGEQLLQYSHILATTLDKNVPIKYLALEPANSALEKYYDKRGFTKLDNSKLLFAKATRA
jgi:hypothetical protein